MKVFSDLNIALVNSLPLLQLFNKKKFPGEWKQGKRDGYGRQETYTQIR